ncbi:MAG: hypothetical protein AAGF77_07415 [Bacteroidota bacterium]
MESISFCFDGGCLVLIWIIQLAVYPSFNFFSQEGLLNWHPKYTQRITYVVLPLMVGQLLLSTLETIQQPGILTVVKLLLIVLIWILTFNVFVPLHIRLDSETEVKEPIIKKLVRKNWWRTLLWSLVFVLAVLKNFFF